MNMLENINHKFKTISGQSILEDMRLIKKKEENRKIFKKRQRGIIIHIIVNRYEKKYAHSNKNSIVYMIKFQGGLFNEGFKSMDTDIFLSNFHREKFFMDLYNFIFHTDIDKNDKKFKKHLRIIKALTGSINIYNRSDL